MEKDIIATALILTSAFMNAAWSATVRKSRDRFATVAFVTTCGGMLYIPFTFFVPFPDADLWPWLIASGAAHLAYQLCLARMMDKGALTLVYPIARGTGPLFVALFAFFFLGDSLSLWQLLVIILLVCGIFLTAKQDESSPATRAAVLAALATGIMISSYTIIDGMAVKNAKDTFSFIAWSGVVTAPLIFMVGLKQRGPRVIMEMKSVWKQGLPASVAAHGGYALALYAFSIGNLGEIAALRETSIVFAALIGSFWLNEKLGPRRLGAIALIASSAVLLKII